MHQNAESTSNGTDPAPRWLRIVRNPLVRILLFGVMTFLLALGMHWLLPLPGLAPDAEMSLSGSELWLRALRALVPTVLAYWLLVRWIEGRRVAELAPRKGLTHVAAGWLVGMAIMGIVALAMALTGSYRILGVDAGAYLVGPFVVLALVPGIAEEIIVRGILFRVVEDGLGTWIALALSAAIFGLGHMANPNASAWTSLAIAVEAGLLLGMAYAWTRSLWFCIGLHAAWNFTQGALLGIPVSGIAVPGLIESTRPGPLLLTGGEFGAEASIYTVIVCVSLAGYFTRKAIGAGQIRPPFWRRRKPAPAIAAAAATT